MSKAVPDGYHTVTASLTVKDGAAAIDFYQRAFGAREIMRINSPDGKIMHAEIQVGDSRVMPADEHPGMGCAAPVSEGRVHVGHVQVERAGGLAPTPEQMAHRQREFFASMAKK